ncbi:MAG: cupin domain-containing protein [Thermoplasmatota archaeon]
MARVVDLAAELDTLTEFWSPKEVGRVNDTALKVVQLQGAFARHQHDAEDECFLVLEGRLSMDLDDGTQVVGPGQFIVVPRGVPHRPHCEEPVRLLLIEPASTVQYGDADGGAAAVLDARATVPDQSS